MFKPNNSLKQLDSKVLKYFICANSKPFSIGDAVQIDADGFVITSVGTGNILGIISGIVTERILPVVTDGTTGAEVGSFSGTYTTAADNETVAKVKVAVDISAEDIYSAEVDATPGTTAGSDEIGATFAVATADSLDESSVGTGTQFISFGVDPDDSDRLLVKVNTPLF